MFQLLFVAVVKEDQYMLTHTGLARHLQPTKSCDNSVYAL